MCKLWLTVSHLLLSVDHRWISSGHRPDDRHRRDHHGARLPGLLWSHQREPLHAAAGGNHHIILPTWSDRIFSELINISRKRKKQTTDKSHPHIMRWSETQPVYYFSLASVLHQPPHHLHPPAGSGNPGSCGGEEGKTGSDAIVSHLSSSHQLVRKFHCGFLVCRWRTGWRNVWRSLPRCRINQLKWRKTWSYCRQR